MTKILDCVDGGAGTCRNADTIEELRAWAESLKDPAVTEPNILRGTIVLPDYYIRKTDTNGEFAHMRERAERAEARLSEIGATFTDLMKYRENNVLNFQLEKLDDYLRKIQDILQEKVNHERL